MTRKERAKEDGKVMVDRQMKLFNTAVEGQDTPQTYTGIYSMHKYWSKKPYNIVRNFILKYSKENDIVLDPFCGSGISITECAFTNRKAFGVDINPAAIFITKQMLVKLSTEKLREQFKRLENTCKGKINSFYSVKRNGNTFVGTHFLWEEGDLIEVWYSNEGGRRGKITDIPVEEDLELANSFTYKDIPYHYPKSNFFHNPRVNAYRENRIYELFTPRNLMALSFLLNEINRIEDQKLRDIFRFCFTAAVGQASRMVFVVKRRGKTKDGSDKPGRKEVGSWVIGYWVPKENFEINVWNCFDNRWRRIIKAKDGQTQMRYTANEARDFDELSNTFYNMLLINDSAANGLKGVPDNSVDYVITDPPHGDRLPYLELSMMWNEWLQFDVNYEDEIVISDSKDRRKDKDEYYRLLNNVLSEIERVLKPRHYFSLIFNSLDDDTWVSLIRYINSLTFDLHRIGTIGYSANSVVQDNRGAGLKTDFVFTFKKNPGKIIKDIEIYSCKEHTEDFIKVISEYIGSSENGRETYEILNHLAVKHLHQDKFFKLSEALDLIRRNFGMQKNKWFLKGDQHGLTQ